MKKRDNIIILFLFVFLTLIVFRPYFLKGQIPFPANLLVAFYSPWKHHVWDGYANGPPNKPIGFDVIRYFYPYRKFTTEQLKSGQWPLWNPYNFTGNVHLATYQSAVFYPLNILYFLLPLIDAWSILVIIQPILAALFMYLFLKAINLSKKAAFFGGLAFAFSGWMLAWSEESLVIEHSALWLPLILYGVERTLKKISPANLLLLVFAAAASILAGFLQSSIYVLGTVFAWTVFRFWQSWRRDLKKIAVLGVGFFFSFLISAPQVLPAIEAYFTAVRGAVESRFLFEDYLLEPQRLLTFLAPDFWGNPGFYNYFSRGFYHEKVIYFGIPAFLLALFALLSRQKNKELIFFKRFSLLTLALAFVPLGWLLYYSRLPLISTMIPSRIAFLSTFGFCILAAFGVDLYFQKKINWRNWQKIVMAVSLVLMSLWLFVVYFKFKDPLSNYVRVSLRNLVLPTGFFISSAMVIVLPWLNKKLKTLSFLGLVVLSFTSSLYFANKFLYFSERKYVFPEVKVIAKLKEISGLDRVWGYGNAYFEKNMNAFYSLYSPEGYDALFSQRYGELLYATETEGKITDQITRSDAGLKQASEREGLLDNWPRRRLLSLLAVRYIMEAKVGEGKEWQPTEKRFPKEFFNLAWEGEKFKIWEYQEALPRAFLVYDYLVETDKQKIADYLFDENLDLSKTVILEEEPQLTIQQCNNKTIRESVEIIKYTPNKIEISVVSSCDSLLFLSDNYYPGWRAVVRPLANYGNAQKAKIYLADFAFRAVALPEGEHQVIFSYEPKIFVWSLRISFLSLIFFIGWLVLQVIKL